MILLDDRWSSKKYRLHRIYARMFHHWFRLASYKHLNFRSTKHKLKHSIDLDYFETKCNVEDEFIIYGNNYWLHDSVTREIVTPQKPMSTSNLPQSTLVFSGWQFPMLPSRAVNIYIMLLPEELIYNKHKSFEQKTLKYQYTGTELWNHYCSEGTNVGYPYQQIHVPMNKYM